MLRVDAAAGDGTHRQQLVRQVSSGDALVARGAFRFVEPSAAAGEKSRVVRIDSPERSRARKITRLSRRALAQDGWTGRARQPFAGWTAFDLAAAASDLLR